MANRLAQLEKPTNRLASLEQNRLAELEQPPKESLGFWQKTKRAWDIGGKGADLDFQWRDVKYGRITKEQAEKNEAEFHKKLKENPLEARNWLENLYLKTVSIAHPMVSGQVKGLTYGTMAAGAAAAFGQAGPQVALPEEIVTMPTAFGIGNTIGALTYWAEQGEGSIYRDAIKAGLSDKTASTVSSIGGPIYGAIEFSQVDKIIPKLGGFAKKTVLSAIIGYLKRIGVEVLEEGEQKIVTEGAVKLLGKALEGKIAVADVPDTAKEIGLSAVREMKEAIGPMAFLTLPGGSIDVGKAIITKPKPTPIVKPTEAPPERPVVPKVGVKPKKGIITPPKPTEAKPEPPVKVGKPAKEAWEMTGKELVELKQKGDLTEDFGIEPWQVKTSVAVEAQKILGGKIETARLGQERIIKKAVSEGKPVPREVLEEYKSEKWAQEALEEKPTEEVVVSKPTDIPKAPKTPITEQKPTVELKGKEAQVFNEAIRTQEKITTAEESEVGIEPAGASFTEHLDTFHSYQLPATSKIPRIVHEMKVINGKRLAGSLTPTQANNRIYNLRKELMQTAIREKIALRLSKIGKVKIGLRKSGVFVPEKFATYTKFKDIEPLLGGGQDITRAIQQMDGSLRLREKVGVEGQAGPIERHVLWRTRTMTLQKLNWLKEKTIEVRDILSARKGSVKDKEINLILEQIGKADRDVPIKDVLSKETLASMSKESIKSAQELRQFYDDLIEEQNAARVMRSQDPIPYRRNYSPHILRDATVWEQLFMRDKTAKDLEKADLPDYIKPNAPFNPRAQAREADIPYDKRVLSARELAESYVMTASKDIFNTSIIQNNKAFIDQLRSQGYEKSANYLGEWNATAYAGIKPGLDRHIKLPKWAQGSLRYFNRLRNMAVFPLNVAWSLSTQPLSLSNTVGRYGLSNTVRGFFQWMKPSIRRQAAQDYYSFIVKSTKRGGVTRQDAANLLGENIKTQKTVGEFVENFSTIVLTEMEKLLTGTSIRAAHLHGAKRGLKGEALKQYASDGGGKTQSMYNDEDKPMILRSLLVKSATPYQTYAFEVANTFREWAGKTGTPPDTILYAMWSVTRWLAAMIVLRLLANQTRGKKWAWWDLVPIPFRETLFSPIVRAITGEFGQTAYGLPSPIGTGVRIGKGINDVLETGSWRKLRNEMIRYGPGALHPFGLGIPGGVQWSRMVDAIIAYSNGGVKDRRGRLLFKMDTPEDLARGMFTGVWSTKGGREYLKKRTGKKEEPRTRRPLE